jgi:hypothetical protein
MRQVRLQASVDPVPAPGLALLTGRHPLLRGDVRYQRVVCVAWFPDRRSPDEAPVPRPFIEQELVGQSL